MGPRELRERAERVAVDLKVRVIAGGLARWAPLVSLSESGGFLEASLPVGQPLEVHLPLPGGAPLRLRASAVIVGNVGWLQGGIRLLPEALPDDGTLDAVVLTAHGWAGWLRVAVRVLLRRESPGQMTSVQFRQLTIHAEREQPWELDGEVMGGTRRLMITTQPGRVLLRVPPAAPA